MGELYEVSVVRVTSGSAEDVNRFEMLIESESTPCLLTGKVRKQLLLSDDKSQLTITVHTENEAFRGPKTLLQQVLLQQEGAWTTKLTSDKGEVIKAELVLVSVSTGKVSPVQRHSNCSTLSDVLDSPTTFEDGSSGGPTDPQRKLILDATERLAQVTAENSGLRYELAESSEIVKQLQESVHQLEHIVQQRELTIQQLQHSQENTGKSPQASYKSILEDFEKTTEEQLGTIAKLKTEKNELSKEITGLRSSLAQSKDLVDSLKAEKFQLEERTHALQSECQSISLKGKHSLTKLQSDLEYVQFEKDQAETEKETVKTEHSRLKKDFQNYKEDAQAQIQGLDQKLSATNLQLTGLSKELRAAQAETSKLQVKLAVSESSGQEYTDQMQAHYEQCLEDLKQELAQAHTQYSDLCGEFEASNHKHEEAQQLLRNEIAALKEELAAKDEEINNLKATVFEHEQTIANLIDYKQLYEDMKATVADLKLANKGYKQRHLKIKNEAAKLENAVKAAGQENATANKRIEELENALKAKNAQADAMQNALNQRYTKELYTPVRSDPLDVAMSQYINSRLKPLEIPFVREDSGVYRFGFRRVFAKIQNGVLSIRVGGGYMLIEEFIELYTPIEIEKLLAKSDRRSLGLNGLVSTDASPASVKSELTATPIDNLEEGKYTTMFTPARSQRPQLKRSTTVLPSTFTNLTK